jgi:hypothetical protein
MTVLVERFPRWVESVELLPASARFAALREAAEAIGGRLDRGAVLDMVTYAVGRESAAAFAAVRSAVSALDPSFNPSASDLEPHLVASAAVARALENDDLTTAVVAGAVLSAEFAGLYSPVAELTQLARAAQARRFRGLRERGPMPRVELARIIRTQPSFVADSWRSTEAVERLAGATRALAEQLESVLTGLGQHYELRLDAADEELDVLWWAFGAHDGNRGADSTEADAPTAVLAAGRELADRHRFRAEIPTTREILRRVLGPLAEVEFVLADVIAAAAGSVELDDAPPGPLFVILTSNATWAALRDQADWVVAAGRLGADATIRRRGDEIAAQTVRELLLARALG